MPEKLAFSADQFAGSGSNHLFDNFRQSCLRLFPFRFDIVSYIFGLLSDADVHDAEHLSRAIGI